MIISANFKTQISSHLSDAKSIWIASAIISTKGWEFIQNNIALKTEQYFLIGIDLATEPSYSKKW